MESTVGRKQVWGYRALGWLDALKNWFSKRDEAGQDIWNNGYLIHRAAQQWRDLAQQTPALGENWGEQCYEVCISSNGVPQPLSEEADEVLRAIEELPLTPTQRQIFERHTQFIPYPEIAKQLNLSKKEVLKEIISITSDIRMKVLQSRPQRFQ